MRIDSIIRVMEGQLSTHEELIEVGELKKSCIVNGDVQSLSKLLSRESTLIKKVAALEESREQAVTAYFSEKGMALTAPTMEELLKVTFRLEEKKELRRVREKLLERIAQLKEVNELNQQLLQQSLHYVNISIDLLTDQPNQEFTYSKPQQTANPSRRGVFDRKA